MHFNGELRWADLLAILSTVVGVLAVTLRLLLVLDRLTREVTELRASVQAALKDLEQFGRELRDHVIDSQVRYEQINSRLMWLEERAGKWRADPEPPTPRRG